MFSKILVAVNGTDQCKKVLQLVTSVATGMTQVHVICVIDLEYSAVTKAAREASPAAEKEQLRVEKILADAQHSLSTHNITSVPHIIEGIPEYAIPAYARDNQCDLIIMGHHHMTTYDRLTGNSVARVVLENAWCPVLIEVR
jgi:nucleotide-binding universal stress UspA family protein